MSGLRLWLTIFGRDFAATLARTTTTLLPKYCMLGRTTGPDKNLDNTSRE